VDNIDDEKGFCIELSDSDIVAAMKSMQGYLDITPADLKEIYRFAYHHAYERIMKSVSAADIMTREVITVGRSALLSEVAGTMASNGVSGVPVLDNDGKIAGVVSGKDFLKNMGAGDNMNFMLVIAECLKGGRCVSAPISKKRAEDIMTSPAITVEENTNLREISAILSSKKINRVPIVDKKGVLVGIVSRADIVRSTNIFIRFRSKDS
jgi:CBS domain-containing membrane protein